MQVTRIAADSLGIWPKLIRDFLLDESGLEALHTGKGSIDELKSAASERSLDPEIRSTLTLVIEEQYSILDWTAQDRAALEKLRSPNSVTITTGHQLCLAGGPLYFFCKIASVISIARAVEKESGVPVVPVFWLASEDHDFEEINHFYLAEEKQAWASTQVGAVGHFDISDLPQFFLELLENPTLGRWKELIQEWTKCYQQGTLSEATRRLVHKAFGHTGLLMLDADDPRLKTLFVPVMRRELADQVALPNVQAASELLSSKGYKSQVTPRDINLFYLHEKGRDRIVLESETYRVLNTSIEWNWEGINETLNQHPERFSPNVILRPVYQEVILPNIAYIGGPGEISYWLQLKSTFDAFSVPFPQLRVRHSALFVPPGAQKKMGKLGLSWEDLFRDEHQLQKSIALQANLPETSLEQQSILQAFEGIEAKLTNFDASLGPTVKGEKARVEKAFGNLEKRLIKAGKIKQEGSLAQLSKLLGLIFPDGKFQERRSNFMELQLFFADSIPEAMVDGFDASSTDLHIFTDS